MNESRELRTERLLLRRWRREDREPFAAMSADPRVMEFFAAVQTREESDASVDRIEAHWEKHGFGLWAVEIAGVSAFAGVLGVCHPRFEAHFTPCVEIGWRLATDHWGRGYATEGAQAAVAFGFDELKLTEIVAMTVPDNVRSRRVMEKLGMTCRPEDDFDHPMLAPDHPRRRHVLYRLGRCLNLRSEFILQLDAYVVQ